MGEVYRARDTQLGREVAIKVIASAFAIDKDRLRRFEQEACAAGALNHPNVLTVHDISTHEGSPYVVSELLEGETLRQRISGTPFAQRRAIEYALHIANGLAAAHEKGIIHRDLKPDNIFITNDGRVKILDFGLAKLIEPDGNQVQTEVPTRRVDTNPGVVVGTMGYMSPEQLKGRPVDQRSDIFSFGAILYEMLSGRRAFHGDSPAETMSAILREDPPTLSQTNQIVSPAIERLVNRCLEKNPESRFHSASDLAFALDALSGSNTVSNQTMANLALPPTHSRVREWLPWAVAAAALMVATITFAWSYVRRAPIAEGNQVLRFIIPLPQKARLFGAPAISPDGDHLVYRLNTEDGKELLWLHAMRSLDAQPLPGTDGGLQAFWSPDSRSFAFFAGGKLKKVDLSGGAPQTICDTAVPANTSSGAWNREGTIILAIGAGDGLYRVSAAGGTPVRLTQIDKTRNDLEHIWPQFLPDGRHFVYLARNAQPENSAIYLGSLDSTETKRLTQAHSSVAYAAPGYLLFLRETTLMAQRFDVDRFELKGDAFPVAEQVVRNPVSGRAMFSVSDNGLLTVRTGGLTQNQLIWFDRTGKQLAPVTSPGGYTSAALSPDEKMVATSRAEAQTSTAADVWLIDLERGAHIRFTTDPSHDSFPVWSPSGDRIAFLSTRAGLNGIYQKPSSGAGAEEVLVTSRELKYTPDWSPDGRFIMYSQLNSNTRRDLMLLPLSGERKPEPYLQSDFAEIQPRFSPDGKWVAYVSNETGQFEVYVQSFPRSGGKWPVSIGGGSQPQWRADGRELYYYTPDRKLMSVEVNSSGSTFQVAPPRPLFEMRVGGAGVDLSFPGSGYYEAARDGKRFLVASAPEIPETQQMYVVVNWTADLKR